MKTLKDHLNPEHFDIYYPECLLPRVLNWQSKLADIVLLRFPLLYKSYYNVRDLEFDLYCELHIEHVEPIPIQYIQYTLTTSEDVERRFANLYPEKVL